MIIFMYMHLRNNYFTSKKKHSRIFHLMLLLSLPTNLSGSVETMRCFVPNRRYIYISIYNSILFFQVVRLFIQILVTAKEQTLCANLSLIYLHIIPLKQPERKSRKACLPNG